MPSHVWLSGQAVHALSLTYWSAAHLIVSVPAPPYARAKRRRERRAARARTRRQKTEIPMDAGDADVEVVVVALDGERVVAVAALRAREASTRASGRARGERRAARADEATTDQDPGWTRETLT